MQALKIPTPNTLPDLKEILVTPAPVKKLANKRNLKWLIGGLAAGVLVTGGLTYWHFASMWEETDNATITGHVHNISSRVEGVVTDVLVDDNQVVPAGTPIVRLDTRDFQTQVMNAQASLDRARSQLDVASQTVESTGTSADAATTGAASDYADAVADVARAQSAVNDAKAGVAMAQAKMKQQEAEVVRAKNDFLRYKDLEAEGAISTQQLDSAKRDLDVANAAMAGAKDNYTQSVTRVQQASDSVKQAQAKVLRSQSTAQQAKSQVQQTDVRRKEVAVAKAATEEQVASLRSAELNLSYATIVAPVEGTVGRKTVEVGQRIQAGQPLMALVSPERWVVANFKETQLARMKAGQEVEVEVDALPGAQLKGTLDSFSPASGAQFALLPPDNATGNFTKIVQRVPVKILLSNESMKKYGTRITPGMSVIAKVKVAD